MKIDLDHWRIGVLARRDLSKQLHTYPMMRITVGKNRSKIEIYGPVKLNGRPRYTSTPVPNMNVCIQARELAIKWDIIRDNVEVIYEDE